MEKNKILIGSDIVPTKSNKSLFATGNIKELFGVELCTLLKNSYNIFNLEVPLTSKNKPIKKYGLNFAASPEVLVGVKKMGVDLVTVANNHIMDQGVEGLSDTLYNLKTYGISYVGAGENLQEAKKPFIIELNEKKIGVYACTEHEFSIAEDNKPGANPFDSLESLDHIQELRKDCDFLVVLYHGGKEYYPYPSPDLQKVCRAMVRKGADLVLCQHSHCIGSMEKYSLGTIIYGQGNFIFDGSEDECWQSSILVQLTISDAYTVEFIPIEKKNEKVRLADNNKAEKILMDFYKRSEEIIDPFFVREKYNEFSEKMMSTYLSNCMGKLGANLLFRLINYIFSRRLILKNFDNNQLVRIQNIIECEAHRELFLTGIKKHLFVEDNDE